MHLKKEPPLPDAYHAGWAAHASGLPRTAPSFLSWRDRHWFAAGWNDRDMELKPWAA